MVREDRIPEYTGSTPFVVSRQIDRLLRVQRERLGTCALPTCAVQGSTASV